MFALNKSKYVLKENRGHVFIENHLIYILKLSSDLLKHLVNLLKILEPFLRINADSLIILFVLNTVV